MATNLLEDYPWVQTPLIVGAPMRLISLASLAVEISKAGGLGFLASAEDQRNLQAHLEEALKLLQGTSLSTANNTLPIGIGFLNWGADLSIALPLIQRYRPAAIWLFGPRTVEDLTQWTRKAREATGRATKVWVQIGSVVEALKVCKACEPDVLVVQGADAGGHGLAQSASIVPGVPEVDDALSAARNEGSLAAVPLIIAAGGIADGRGVAAAMALGAQGAVLGTRYLAAEEAVIAKGYRQEVIRVSDGGQTTLRTSLYDRLRGTTSWPPQYNARGILNMSYWDGVGGMAFEENERLYREAMNAGDDGWGPEGRMTTYVGANVGLVTKVQSAKEITEEVRQQAKDVIRRLYA
ncbi:putative oxidoreductase [Trichodelitschia bisporula]|uniref:Putative oxidoreductase n=1 Tax=Trichodelitschia bisporula TaxID=703511 RepID=A0A6G1IB88_9PEZI|nr:putative oxidoreductase [Trichodelitschia bisporula]